MLTSEREVCVAKSKPKGSKSSRTIRTPDGKAHRYLNEAFPTGDHLPAQADGGNLVCHPIDCLCERCGHGYSAQARRTEQPCEECHGEDVAERAAWLEAQGIPMGAGVMRGSLDTDATSRGGMHMVRREAR